MESSSMPPTAATAPRGSFDAVRRQGPYLAAVLRRTWRGSIVSAFVSPLLYVVAMGVVLGGYIPGDPDTLEGAPNYLMFVVPGLIASHAMQIAVGDMTYPVLAQIKWDKTYHSAVSTPLTPSHLVAGQFAFVGVRLLVTCAVFMAVIAPFGVFSTWWGPLLALLAQIGVGMAFAALTMALTVRMDSPEGFGVLFRLGVFPLFLFSGAFFPVANLGAFAWLAYLTPLWHGVDLSRMFTLGTVRPGLALVHVAVLLVLIGVGYRLSCRGLERRLVG
jgi:lipooligosaccharide transport system permease protein